MRPLGPSAASDVGQRGGGASSDGGVLGPVGCSYTRWGMCQEFSSRQKAKSAPHTFRADTKGREFETRTGTGRIS